MKGRGRQRWVCLLCCLGLSLVAAGQGKGENPDETQANPGRPTISTPATLTPVGYLQFESGLLTAWQSPEFSSQQSVNEVIKFALNRRLELICSLQPYAHTNSEPRNAPGDVLLGVQAVIHHGEGAGPTIAVSYLGRAYSGTSPNLDIGSAAHTVNLLVSADVKGFQYDTNYLFSDVEDGRVNRAQFSQTLSISHPIKGKWQAGGEIWHFTQPFLRSRAVGNLWNVSYAAKKNLVFDAGFNHGLTSTSTHWELFAGFTYVLPKKLW